MRKTITIIITNMNVEIAQIDHTCKHIYTNPQLCLPLYPHDSFLKSLQHLCLASGAGTMRAFNVTLLDVILFN